MNNITKNLFLWLIIGSFVFVVFSLLPSSVNNQSITSVPYSEFMNMVKDGKISETNLSGYAIHAKTKDGITLNSYAPDKSSLVSTLLEKGVVLRVTPPEQESASIFHIFLSWLPMLILIGLSIFSFRQIQSGGNKAMGFGKSKAKLMGGDTNSKITFSDVAGIDEAKQELQEVVDFLKDPKKFQRLGGRIPRGVLLVGPPGTGKTLLAKAIAGEAGVPYFIISGSDFVEMFVGVGASRVRDMFEQAKKSAPCIIFIDEIDAVGRHRGAGLGGGNDEREQTLNQLLVEMDGFEENQGVILIAATNRPDILDPALLRPGRFDRQVIVPNPDLNGREKILLVHMKKVAVAKEVDAKVIARGTPGFSGADLANLVNEAALMAARVGKISVGMEEFEQAKDKVMMGPERRSLAMSDEEKKLTAYHEAGHAIVAYYTPNSHPIHKATIIPRGRSLGFVMRLPERDEVSESRIKLVADLKVAMGGRIAEELIFGYDMVTTGAYSDIKQATDKARKMIAECGMSDKLGFQTYSGGQEEVFLGYQMGQQKRFSELTLQTIDQEVHLLLDKCYKETDELLKQKINQLHLLAKSLIEYETLSGAEIKELLENNKISKTDNNQGIFNI